MYIFLFVKGFFLIHYTHLCWMEVLVQKSCEICQNGVYLHRQTRSKEKKFGDNLCMGDNRYTCAVLNRLGSVGEIWFGVIIINIKIIAL